MTEAELGWIININNTTAVALSLLPVVVSSSLEKEGRKVGRKGEG